MSQCFPRFASTGLMAAGVAASLSLLSAIAPPDVTPTRLVGPLSAQAQTSDEETRVRVYNQASPGVVSLETPFGTGSGSIISADGLILTNAHVVRGSNTVTVQLADGREFQGQVIAFGEPGLDLAAVRINAGGSPLPTIPIANPNNLNVGQTAFAIGNPFGQFQGTLTVGIVSRIDSEQGLIQTDAAINPGNSGGPLLNSQGELIGVNTSIFTTGRDGGNIGIGFAIPTNRVTPFLTAVREGRAPTAWSQFANVKPILPNGQTVQGVLDETSNILDSDRSYFNAYTFEARAGQRILIDMLSNEIDAYLILIAPDGQDLGQDDDSGGGTNARLVATAPVSGEYTILANSYGPGEVGLYNIRVEAREGTVAPNAPGIPGGGAILQEQGVLQAGSNVLPADGSLYEEHAFQGQAGQTVTINLQSSDFNTYLILIGPNEQVIDQNDDMSPNSRNSELTVTLPVTGTYRAIANAYDASGRGSYQITVR
ncbi:MAG: trypsin-like peptidase domain-containing protein [Synechococcales bacterium]|nr:trypsin-like peptidase domain-containing protein [Synechococcales bacterium]